MTPRHFLAYGLAALMSGCAACPELCGDGRSGGIPIAPEECFLPYRVKLQVVVPAAPGEAPAGLALSPVPRVRVVLDGASDIPLPRARVRFRIKSGGGELRFASRTDSTFEVFTNGAGEASLGWVLGAAPGLNELDVEIPLVSEAGPDDNESYVGKAFGSPVTLQMQGVPRAAATIVKEAGDGGVAAVQTALPERPRVRLADQYGPIAGAAVRFEVRAGGGTVTGTGTVVTGADGTADVEWVLGRAAGTDNNRLAAVVDGTSLEAEFVASATAGPAVRLVPITPAEQTADAGTAVPVPPRVRLADRFDNSIVGLDVAFAVGPSGGTLDGQAAQTIATDADGVAAAGTWQVGTVPGTYFVTATVTGAGNELIQGNPARFDATAAPPFGPPVAMTVVQGGGQTVTVGSLVPMPPAVQLTDALDRPVPGAEVAFSVAAGSGSITGAVATTDATGTATLGSWVLGTGAGLQTVTATGPAGVSPATVDVQVAATAGPAATIVKVAGDNQFSVAGAAVAVRPTVEIRDQFGNPVAGVSVNFAIEAGGGSVGG
ncbi:MAG: hypothetical protein AB7L66_00570, partial [Gemmatimonadales bacterium]